MIEIRQKNLKVIIKFYNDFKMQRNICNIRKRKKKRKKFKAWRIIDGSRKNNFNFTKISKKSLFNPFYQQYMIQI